MIFNTIVNRFSLVKRPSQTFIVILVILCANLNSMVLFSALSRDKIPLPVEQGKNGQLVYVTDISGNRITDFSYCGYMAGERAIPDVPVRIVVPAIDGDATLHIQSAIDYVASLSPDDDGIRGAVLLEKGLFQVNGTICIHTSGVVLRGCGADDKGTVLLGNGIDRNPLIYVAGKNDLQKGYTCNITDNYVPVNAMAVHTDFADSFRKGDRIMIVRPSTMNWIEDLGMEDFGGAIGWNRWNPGTRDLCWDRTITAIDGNRISFDAPITTAMDVKYGGGLIASYVWPGRISNTGVENLFCMSAYDENNPKDEDHRWMAITMENVQDAWVRQVVFRHFAGSAVALYETTKRITIEDCKSTAPVSEIGGMRRNTYFTSGQQTLFQRCYAESGYHDFAAGFCAAGPNAFVQCESHLPYSFSGAIDSWASGVLFDNVNIDGNALSFKNLRQAKQGAGWNAANSVIWQSTASRIDCYSPPTACNWSFGSWAEFSGDGKWYESNNYLRIRCLYYGQLADRIGDSLCERACLLPVSYEGCTSPTIEEAGEFAEESARPCISLSEWIDQARNRQPIPTEHDGVITVDQIELRGKQPVEKSMPVEIVDGRLQCNGMILTGSRIRSAFWKGTTRPYGINQSSVHVTRFAPGRVGKGLTDDLADVAECMTGNHIAGFEHRYGLWYDRRRDDHERIRRMDGDVWPPFYEMPFARSGKGTAWDGLSKYDLMKYNPWYWKRLNQFASLADQNGFLLIHHNYFQHNILEAGAHWSDFPWRTANNINNTGFPEPVPYAGNKRIFMAGQFYDVDHPVRRKIHQAYIKKCLDNFRDDHNVIQFVGSEYTGPLTFTRFWIDVIMEWQVRNNSDVMVALSTPKDIQDSILMDPVRSRVIDIIDIRYWQYRKDRTLYAPQGGQNLAPRQHARLTDPGGTSFDQVYRAVREYRNKYPDKAVMFSFDLQDKHGWAVLMAGGSMANIPVIEDSSFLRDAAFMKPLKLAEQAEKQYAIGNEEAGYIIYNNTSNPVIVDQSRIKGNEGIFFIDPETGSFIESKVKITKSEVVRIPNPNNGAVVVWIKKSSSISGIK